MEFSIPDLASSIQNDAAIRRRRRLLPAGGAGDKIFPPTYPGERRNAAAQHVFEQRRVDGGTVWCVLIDSVQSQANRLEEALLNAVRDGAIGVPMVTVDFREANLGELTEITSLDAPHRIFDAILRDSLLNDVPFMNSDLGRKLQLATMRDASAIFEVSPTVLIFGAWNSTGQGGGVGAKFPRCITSEIIGVNVPVEILPVNNRTGEAEVRTAARRPGSRIDPLGILSSVPIYVNKAKEWDVDKAAMGKDAKLVRPSEINHGNIRPSVQALGVTIDYAEHVAVLSLAGLRRLSFGNKERDTAARNALALLALLALVEQERQGYALRSRCDLVPDGPSGFEVVHADGTVENLIVSLDAVRAAYAQALAEAKAVGFIIPDEAVRLMPQSKLVTIIRMSRDAALRGEGHDDDTAADASA